MARTPRDPISAFHALVKRQKPNECWPWQGGTRNYYGRFYIGRRAVAAHRFAYELAHGPIPPGKLVMHSCDNPPCCNPAHLTIGTGKDNADDRDTKGRHRVLRGSEKSQSQLGEWQVLAVRRAYAEGGSGHRGQRGRVTYASLAAEYGVSEKMIGKIIRGDTWQHVTRPEHNGAVIPRFGNAHVARISDADAQEIRQRYAAGGISQRALGERFGISQPAVSLIVQRKTWGHI